MPKLMWLSPYSLHDDFSSAAQNCKALLEGLAQIGWEITACTSFILEADPKDNDDDALGTLKQSLAATAEQILPFSENQVRYVYIRSKFHQEDLWSLGEMQTFYDTFIDLIDSVQPDFILGFGTSTVFQSCMAEAKRRGIWTLYMLLNANYQNYNFPNIDYVLTSSQANAQLYYQTSRLRTIPVGESFSPQNYLAPTRTPRYITFVNPGFEKGLSFIARIAYAYQQIDPEQRFLVVNNQGDFVSNLRLLRTTETIQSDQISFQEFEKQGGITALQAFSNETAQDDQAQEQARALANAKIKTIQASFRPLPNMFDVQHFPNVDQTGRQANLKEVYALSKVILLPSLWWESWSRIATEAILNNIPVVASTSGGLVESTAGAGIHIPISPVYQHNYLQVPTAEAIQPWLEGIQRALTEDRSAKINQARFNLASNQAFNQLQSLLLPLYAQQRSTHIAYGNARLWTQHQKRSVNFARYR